MLPSRSKKNNWQGHKVDLLKVRLCFLQAALELSAQIGLKHYMREVEKMKYLKHGIKIPESHHLLQETPYLLHSLH